MTFNLQASADGRWFAVSGINVENITPTPLEPNPPNPTNQLYSFTSKFDSAGTHEVSVTVSFVDADTHDSVDEDSRMIVFPITIHVINVDLTMNPYLGINMVDPTKSPVDFEVATATVTPDITVNYAWTLNSEITKFDPDPGTGKTATIKEKGIYSSSYLNEKVEVAITPGGCTAETNFTVVQIDTEMQGLAEASEEVVGGFVCLNDDDDNTNGIPDFSEEPVANEDDLVAITNRLYPSDLPTNGTVSIAGYENLYEDPWKNVAASNSYPVSRFPLTLWVEGKSVSYWPRDKEIVVTHDPSGAIDEVKYTVIKVDLDIANGGSDLDNGEVNNSSPTTMLSETDEDDVGAYVLVNWDDDDADGQIKSDGTGWQTYPRPDLEQTGTVQHEDNLAKLNITIDPGGLPANGIVVLEAPAEDDKITFWKSATKDSKLDIVLASKKYYWDLTKPLDRAELQSLISDGLWMEGVKKSALEKDIEVTLKYQRGGVDLCSDSVKATIVMLNLGNVVGREVDSDLLAARGHTSIVARFDGTCTKANLVDAAQYILYESDGTGIWLGTPGSNGPREAPLLHITANPDDAGGLREFFGSLTPFLSSYRHPTHMQDTVHGYRIRLRILGAARHVVNDASSIGYTKFDAMRPNSSWAGSLNTIQDLRCDGFVEVCYEWNFVSSWGKITTPGGVARYSILMFANQNDHNEFDYNTDPALGQASFWGWLMPITQIGYADTYIDNHFPPYSTGDFNYTADNFKGTFWDSAFSEQQLVEPTITAP